MRYYLVNLKKVEFSKIDFEEEFTFKYESFNTILYN